MFLSSHQSTLPYWRLSAFYLLFFMGLGGFLPYWPRYLESLGFSTLQIATLSTTMVITKVFSVYLWGWFADHTQKRRYTICLTSFLSVLSFTGVLFANGYWGLLIGLFIFSIFWGAALPQIEAITLSHLKDSTHDYTKIRIWGSIGFIIAVILLSWIPESTAIQRLPLILLGILILQAMLTLSIPEHHISLDACHQDQHPGLQTNRIQIIILLGVCLLMQASHGAYYTFFTLFLEAHAYTHNLIGILWAVGVITEVLVFIIMHHLINRYGLKPLMIISLVLATTRWLMIGYFVNYFLLLLIAQALHAATFGIYHAVSIQYIHRLFHPRQQGRGQALYSSISFGVGLALGGYISGYLWEMSNTANIMFLFSALLSLLALLIGLFWLK